MKDGGSKYMVMWLATQSKNGNFLKGQKNVTSATSEAGDDMLSIKSPFQVVIFRLGK